MDKTSDEEREVALAEYNALRAEILHLIQVRDQFLIFDLTGFGVLFGLAIQFNETLFLVAPLIHYPLMLYWAHADRAIQKIGLYIRDEIESRFTGMRWETSMIYYGLFKSWREPILTELEPILTKLITYIPLKSWRGPILTNLKTYVTLTGFSPTELSGLTTFAGSTAISLLLWLSVVFFSVEPIYISDPPEFNLATVLVLFALDIAIFPCSYRIIRKHRYIYGEYLTRKATSPIRFTVRR